MKRRLPFQVRLPVVAAPMFIVSGPELVTAACQQGVVGAFPTTNCRTVDELDHWMTEITSTLNRARAAQPGAVVAPWAANLITHSSNSRLEEDLALVARYRPPIVITALGSPRPVIETVHGYGGFVFADVVNIALARKAADAGVDGMACISAGAGGHTGHLSPFAFLSAVREFFDGWLVVGGGIADGAGIAGAIAAGADLVYMGTRFLATEECRAVPGYKQMIIDCGPDDLVISAGVTGTTGSWLKPSLRACGMDPDALGGTRPREYSPGEEVYKRWRDVWACGQGLQTIRKVEPVAAVVDRLEREYARARERFCRDPDIAVEPHMCEPVVDRSSR